MDIDDLKMRNLSENPLPAPSKARARYARTNVSRHRQATKRPRPRLKEPNLKTWKERALFQGIICASFLGILLVFNIIDSAPTNAVTAWVDRNLSYDIFAEDGVGGWTDRLLAIFNNDAPAPDYADVTPAPAAPVSSPTPNSWVDESVLEEIQGDD